MEFVNGGVILWHLILEVKPHRRFGDSIHQPKSHLKLNQAVPPIQFIPHFSILQQKLETKHSPPKLSVKIHQLDGFGQLL